MLNYLSREINKKRKTKPESIVKKKVEKEVD